MSADMFDRFLTSSPACVMARATIEKMFSPDMANSLFLANVKKQYERELLFSTVFAAMTLVATRTTKSLHGSYVHLGQSIQVSAKSLYNKVNGVESSVCRALVRHSADTAHELVKNWTRRMEGIEGYQLKVIDGNHISGTEHRLKELRDEPGAALPGQSVAVLMPELGLIEDLILTEDAYVQEIQLLGPIVERLRLRDLIVADRHYCTSNFLFNIIDRQAFFVIRQHAAHLRWKPVGELKEMGRSETGQLFEQEMELTHPQTGETKRVRRITIKLDKPTRDKETEIHIITNLPESDATAEKVAELYRKRWTIETAFKEMTTTLRCELKTLGHPQAALFSFSVAAVCFNVLSVIVAALQHVHVKELETGTSYYALADEISGTYRGMMIALPEETWLPFGAMNIPELSDQLLAWARLAKPDRFRKHVRSSTARKKRIYAPRKHVATSRVLAAKKGKT